MISSKRSRTTKYKKIVFYGKEKQYKQLLKHIGSQAFSRWVRQKMQEELDSIHLKVRNEKP